MAEENKNNPGRVFTILLFLYFYSITISWLAFLYHGYLWGLNSLTHSPVPHSEFLYAAYVVAFVLYSYLAIVSALKLKSWSLPSIRLSIIIFVFLLCQTSLRETSNLNGIWIIGILIFVSVFLQYTIFSKTLKSKIPSRHLKVPGWVGMGMVVVAFLPICCYLAHQKRIQKHSEPVTSMSNINLYEGETSDRLSIYRLNKGWSIDSIVEYSNGEQLSYLSPCIRLSTIISDKVQTGASSARQSFHDIIANSTKDFDIKKNGQIETFTFDTVIGNNPLCISSYKLLCDSKPEYVTFAALFSLNYHKVMFLSCQNIDSTSVIREEELLRFMKTVNFDTSERLTPN